MSARNIRHKLSAVLVWLCLFALYGAVSAQDAAAPIEIGHNAFDELSADSVSIRYAVTANGGETVTIQVLALADGFSPRFRVMNPAGVELLSVTNPDSLTSLTGSASFADAGSYIIEIQGENGTFGQFVLSLQPGAPLPEAVELTINQPISDTLDNQTPLRVYGFSTATEPLVLTILSDRSNSGVLVNLYDEDAGRTIATNDAGVTGVAYRLPAAERRYRVEVRANGAAGDTSYTICLGTCGGSPLAGEPTTESNVGAIVETPDVSAPGDTTCRVASGTGGSINVRSGPGTQYAVIGNLAAGQSAPVLGQFSGGGWYQVSLNGQTGWVAASVTRLEGTCTALASVAAPAGAQLAPTQAPPAPTQSSGGGSSSAPTAQGPLPDLLIELSSASVRATYVEAIFVIDNKGTVSSGPFNISICANDTCITESVSSVEPSVPKFFDRQINYAAIASVTIRVTVDSGNQVTESNEGNNVVTATREPPMPDLTASIASFYIDGVGAAHVEYAYSNSGSGANESSFTIHLCVDLTCADYPIATNMSPGAVSSGITIFNVYDDDPLAALTTATVTVDYYNAVAESNENNNAATAYPS